MENIGPEESFLLEKYYEKFFSPFKSQENQQ